MSKHTPGPWDIYFNSRDDFVVRKMFPDGQESHEIARCRSGAYNALLIAAAPDLLEALNAMLDTCYDLERDDDVINAVAKARAAIAKAKGEV
jgi:hypothetical protein